MQVFLKAKGSSLCGEKIENEHLFPPLNLKGHSELKILEIWGFGFFFFIKL